MAVASNPADSSPQISQLFASQPEDDQNKVAPLYTVFPEIKNQYKIVKKIGQGAFSSVFLANNVLANGQLSKELHALKYVVPTTHPKRIVNELKCLYDLRDENNIINVTDCIRKNEHVILVMPYFAHDNFYDCIEDMTVEESRRYMENLISAVCKVHSHGIIHRDIKPNNFLYCRKTKRYALVDFGLAQRVSTTSSPPPAIITKSTSSSSFVKLQDLGKSSSGIYNRIVVSNTPKRKSNENEENQSSESKKAAVDASTPVGKQPLKPKNCQNETPSKAQVITTSRTSLRTSTSGSCYCYGRAHVCSKCLSRNPEIVHRAGTPGFRPPEVLMKSVQQTTAVDMWAVGVMFLCILSGRYPFFTAANDLTAIAEIITLIGSSKMKSAAASINKHLLFQPEVQSEVNLKMLCEKLQDTNTKHQSPDFPDSAYNLLCQLLDPNPKTRITADKALQHPFFKQS